MGSEVRILSGTFLFNFNMLDEQTYIKKFHELLIKSISKLPKSSLALGFSGGIDSSILAKLLKNQNIDFTAYVVGIENCHDFKSAEQAAQEIGIKLNKIILTEEEIKEAIETEVKILQSLYQDKKDENLKPSPLRLSYNLPLFFLAKYAREKYIVLGQGPDEMLGGYEKHLKLNEERARKELKANTKTLLFSGILQNKATIEFFSKQAEFPYLQKEIVDFCTSLPYELKIKDKTRKYLLRKLAENLGLSKSLAFKEKKAMQYGSGIRPAMVKIAKKQGLIVDEYIKRIILQ